MLLKSHRLLRAIGLGLMFFLAVAAPCSANSYDPDPYDDMPPVVSVEFNYVVPSQLSVASIRGARTQAGFSRAALLQPAALHGFAALPAASETAIAHVFGLDSPQSVMPLRR
jgi:hypothetical protein